MLTAACSTLPLARLQVTVKADGQSQNLETEALTVRDILSEAGITLGDLDYVTPPETTRLTQGLLVTVIRVEEHTETYTETLPFGRQVVRDANIAAGDSRLLQSGQAGVMERVYRITLEDGKEVERMLVRETVTQPPRDETLLVGTKQQVQTAYITGTLAYVSQQDAWIIRDNNRLRRRLTSWGDLDGRVFTLSPDGDRLLFTRAVTESEHINELWVIRTGEADPNPLPLSLNDILWADWAPDSTLKNARIAWTTAEPIERAPGWRGRNDLWIGTLTERNILNSRGELLEAEAGGGYGWWGTRYVWDPQGKKLAFSRPESVGVITLNPTKRKTLLMFPAYRTYSSWAWNPAPAWDPEGDFIAATIHSPTADGKDPEESPVFDLWLIEATGAYSAEIASEVGMWATPSFSHDGNALLFGRATVPYQSDNSTHRLCLIDRDGSDARCVYPPGEAPGIEAPSWQWGPDDRSLAFIQYGDIYLFTLADETAQPFTDEGTVTLLTWR
ncbi:MAG: G5 domain-containing protein [Anaerolineae bacterium]|nr:G5 domain-containing protein [Anaerolineae bacterium]